MHKSAPNPRTRQSRIAGFSMVELGVSLTVLLILTAIAIPSLMRSFRTYQLNDAAARLSDMLKFTRFEAVRRNTQVNFLILPSGTPPSSASITAALGYYTTLTTLSGATNTVTFDARGAVTGLTASVFYLGSPSNSEFGYRAVILLPSGATQIWTAPSGGPWQRIG